MRPRSEPAALSVWRPIATDRFLIGVPHYPEQAAPGDLVRDAERMAAAGFTVVRMAEFAWNLLEPSEGRFDFSLFDEAIAVFGHYKIDTILCTPTATPPRWLTFHYPEVLRVDAAGRQMSHGSRQHADTSSPVFRAHSRRITEAMARHFRDTPNVIGWQTDNELNTSMSGSWSESARREFQAWCEAKYATIDALNHAWGGSFWASGYSRFDEIVLPHNQAPVFPSPGHVLDHHRFLAHETARFQQDQVEILRAANPGWFVFHNLGRQADIDFRGTFSTDLDFLGFDIYPFLNDEMARIGGHALSQALQLDLSRSHTGNFIVPEQQSGFGAQPGFVTLTPEPGEMRRMAWSSVARGADGVMFFRWRPAHFGAEIYWMGIIDHDDIPRRRYLEAQQFAREVTALKDRILGSHVAMDIAIAGSDFDNEQAHMAFPMGLPSPQDDATILYRHCYRAGLSVGFIHPEDDLSRLKLLYVPHWLIWRDHWTARIEAFARAGGTVVLSARTGSRDIHNHVIRTPAPGPSLSALAGITVEEFGRIAAPGSDGLFPTRDTQGARKKFPTTSATRRYLMRIGNHEVEAGQMYELLSVLPGTDTIGFWSNRFAEGRAAISSRDVGKGQVIYLGSYLTEALMPALFDDLIAKSGARPLIDALPEGVEVSRRTSPEGSLLFVLNTSENPVSIPGTPPGRMLLPDGRLEHGTLTLPAYGCAIIAEER